MTIRCATRLATLAALLPVAAGASADAASWLPEAIVELDCPIDRQDVEQIADRGDGPLTKSQRALVETHVQIACPVPCWRQISVFSQEVHFRPDATSGNRIWCTTGWSAAMKSAAGVSSLRASRGASRT